jgi:hypothetical protein
MTTDPVIVSAAIALIAAMGGLLLYFLRRLGDGSLLPRATVPREDYEAQVAIVKSYADRFGEQTDAVRALTKVVEKLAGSS